MVFPFPHHTIANWCYTQGSVSSQADAEDSVLMEDCHPPSKPLFKWSCAVKFWSNSPWKVSTCFLSIWRHISSAPLLKINRAVMEKILWFSHIPLRPNQALDLSIPTNAIFNCFLSSCAGTCPVPGAAPRAGVQPLHPLGHTNNSNMMLTNPLLALGLEAETLNPGWWWNKVPPSQNSFLLKYPSCANPLGNFQDAAASQASRAAAMSFFLIFQLPSVASGAPQLCREGGVSRSVNPSVSETLPLHPHESTKQPHQVICLLPGPYPICNYSSNSCLCQHS